MLRGLLGGFARGRRQTSAATLYLDFLAGLNDSRITYSGGTNGTRVNSSGLIVAATTPRFDYNPVTLAAKGLLVEEARTNLMTYSQEFNNAAWLKVQSSVTSNTTTAPSGDTTADKLIEATDVAQVHYVVNPSAVVTSGATYSASVFCKAAERTKIRIAYIVVSGGVFADFDISNGTVVTAVSAFGGGTAVSQAITPFGNGWYRINVTGSGPAGISGQIQIELLDAAGARSYNGNGTSGLFIWGAQLEAGSFPTSYIPTTSAAVTRTADSAVMTGTDFSSWYNQTEGTFVLSGSRLVAGSPTGVAFGAARTGDFNNSMYAFNQTASDMGMGIIVGGVAQASTTAAPASILVPFKFASSYAANSFASCANGGAVNTDVSGSVPTLLDIFVIGSAPWAPTGTAWNGHIQTIQYYPRRVSNEQLQAMTA